jgi:hypothetical protein
MTASRLLPPDTVLAMQLNENCKHQIVQCPECPMQFVLSVSSGDIGMAIVKFNRHAKQHHVAKEPHPAEFRFS